MKLVSIIVPVYNASKYIEKCYSSIIKQDYKKLEIIFVNDGSTDNSLEIINNFKDKRVTIFNIDNTGPGNARLYGFSKSHGDYILFVDSDDTISHNFVSLLINKLVSSKTDICMSLMGIHICYPLIDKITLKARKKPELIDLWENTEYIPALSPGVVGKLFKRSAIKFPKVKFKANEDIVMMMTMYYKNRKISICNEAIYNYYLYKGSQYKTYLLGYEFDNLINTFEPLKLIYEEYLNANKLGDFFNEIEMLFIKNICERINNIVDAVSDRKSRDKFISCLLDYLEYFFPDWENNPYYLNGYKLGEVSDKYRIHRANKYIKGIERVKRKISLEDIYQEYREIEKKIKKKDYISRI